MGRLLSFAGIVATLILLRQWSAARRNRLLPPGPPRLPLVGNMFNWPQKKPWFKFTEWAQTYGDIVYGKIGSTSVLVLNSHITASALLQEKGAKYSDRPSPHFLNNMIGWGSTLIMLPDGAELNEQRRLFMAVLGTRKAIQLFEARIEARVTQFVKRLVAEGSNPNVPEHSLWLTGGLALDVTYGYKASDKHEDELLVLAKQASDDANKALQPGAYIVDTFPWLENLPSWLPGTKFLEEAKVMRERWMRFVNEPFEFAENQQNKETAVPCMINIHLEDKNLTPAQVSSLKWSAAIMYSGGADTTVSAIAYFVLFMLQYPDVQTRAQAELDALLEGNRLPTVRDIDALPYIRALVSEVLRFGPIAPQGFPHLAREDDIHDGYLIPKGTLVFSNTYFMSRDPRNYSDPHIFNPERFLGPEPELDPRKYVFGFGKRACPGRLFAETNIIATITTCLSTITFKPAKDKDGHEVIPKPDFDGILSIHPNAFPCQVIPRSEHSISLLQE